MRKLPSDLLVPERRQEPGRRRAQPQEVTHCPPESGGQRDREADPARGGSQAEIFRCGNHPAPLQAPPNSSTTKGLHSWQPRIAAARSFRISGFPPASLNHSRRFANKSLNGQRRKPKSSTMVSVSMETRLIAAKDMPTRKGCWSILS